MKYALIFFGALLLSAPLASAPNKMGSAPTAAQILSRIATEGGHKVAWDLWDNDREFKRVVRRIESGDAQWLEVARQIKPHSDAALSLSLDYSVALALPNVPARVLALIGHGFDLDRVCTSPFIEPDPGVAEAYEWRTLVALARVTDPVLKSLALKCSQAVRLSPPVSTPARL